MATTVTILGTNFQLPQQNQTGPWGEDLSNLIQGIIAAINLAVGPYDIPITTFTVPNNQSSATNVTSLAFNSAQVRSAIISYSIYRSTATTEGSECGHVYVTYSPTAGTWELARNAVGDAGVTFTITNTGQVKYTSTNYAGASYSGKMTFTAKTFNV